MAESDHITTPGKSPAFQFYPKDFLSDENVRLMSMQERGVYITLMCLCWIEGTLPADVSLLARLAGVPLPAFRKLWPQLLPCFRTDAARDGRLIHPRLERERESQANYRRRQSDNGKKGGRPNKATNMPPNVIVETQINPSLSVPGFPKKSSASAISDLHLQTNVVHTPIERECVPRASVMAGKLQKSHLAHAWCGRVCVPEFLHNEFERASGQTEDALYAFYAEVFAKIPETEPVEPDGLKFWRPLVAKKWPSKHNGQSMHADGTTVEDIAAGLRAARARGAFDARK
jgi:uncharacterized protein YdaU (DUF1376 family)